MKFVATAVAALLACGSAQAAPLMFDAFSKDPSSYSDFSIVFDDTNGDSLLAYAEILSFSGFTCSYSTCNPVTYDAVYDIPLITGFTSDTGPGTNQIWQFLVAGSNPLVSTYPLYENSFTYAISSVPAPASALLLISGIGAAAAFARRARAPQRFTPIA